MTVNASCLESSHFNKTFNKERILLLTGVFDCIVKSDERKVSGLDSSPDLIVLGVDVLVGGLHQHFGTGQVGHTETDDERDAAVDKRGPF